MISGLENNYYTSQWVLVFAFSDLATNKGGIAVYIPSSGIAMQLSTAIDYSSYATGHIMRFGSRSSNPKMVLGYLRHVHIYIDSFFDPTGDISSLLSGRLSPNS